MNPRPSEVTRAVYLLWASLVLSIIHAIVDWSYITADRSAATTAYILLFTWLLYAFLIWRIGEAANWARITLLIFALLLVLPSFVSVLSAFAHSIALGGFYVLQFLLQATALYSLFANPGREWFRQESTSRVIPTDPV